MAYIFSVYNPRGRGYLSGALFSIPDNWSSTKVGHILFPPAVSAIHRRPSMENYGNRAYLVGGHTSNLVIDEEFRASRMGILPPTVAPGLTAGAGTLTQIGYLTYYDENTGERSSLGPGTTITGSNISRVWSSLPTTVTGDEIPVEGLATFSVVSTTSVSWAEVSGYRSDYGNLRPGDRIALTSDLTRWATIRTITADINMTVDDAAMAGTSVALSARCVPRITHIELWLSVSGALPRFVARVRLGTLSISESTPTLALGEAFITTFEPMPYGSINCVYNDRQLIAGVDGHRDLVYLSAIGFPERHEGLQLRTKYNEPVVGMFRYRDYVVVLCPESSYKIQGYTEDDYVMTVLEPEIGGLGHFGNKIADGRAFVPSRKGMQLFNGAFHPALPTRQGEWTRMYTTYYNSYEMGFAVVNPNDQTYQFYPYIARDGVLTPQPSNPLDVSSGMISHLLIGVQAPPTSLSTDRGLETPGMVWVADYSPVGPESGGGIRPPEWTSDTHSSLHTGMGHVVFAAYLTPSGSKVGKLYRMCSNFIVWEEDVTDTVIFKGKCHIVTAHMLLGDVGGTWNEGKKLMRMWSYLTSEGPNPASQNYGDWRLSIWPGDEYAFPPGMYASVSNLAIPGYRDYVEASLKTAVDVPYNKLPPLTDLYDLIWQPQSVRSHQVEGVPTVGRGFTFEYQLFHPLAARFMGLGLVYGPGSATRPVTIVVDTE